MTETTLTTTTTTCRARTTFPWQGMLRDSVTFTDHGNYAAGTLVAVTGATEGGFSVRVGRVQDPPGEPAVTGSVTRAQVDEALGAVIEERLLGNENISWDNDGSWKKLRYVATQDFMLTEQENGEPPKHAMCYQGERLNASLDNGTYYVRKNGVLGSVGADQLSFDASIPPSTSNVSLICYEFGMYAAALAGLCPNFARLPATRAGDAGGYWVRAAGGTLSEKAGPKTIAGLTLQRGDFVLFYRDRGADSSEHTAYATGDAQGLYSLWGTQGLHPVVTDISVLCSLCRPGDTGKVYVRIATPGWHRSPTVPAPDPS
jgi:hypothetical protein